MMAREVKEEEVYEDLSMMLQMIKKKLSMLIRHPHIEQPFEYYDQQQTDSLLAGFRTKYAHITHISPLIARVIERFFIRIKELLNQLILKIPRQRLDLVRIVRELEQFTVRSLNQYNHLAIASFLDLITTVKNPKDSINHIFRGSQYGKRIEQVSNLNEEEPRQCSVLVEGQRRISEVQMTQKNAEKYCVMDIDTDYIRGRYFDLKNSQKSSAENDMMFRNRFIKQIMHAYQLEYNRYKRKQPNNPKRIFCRFRKRQDRWQVLQSFTNSQNRIETIDSVYFNRSTRPKNEAAKQRRELHGSSIIADRKNRQNKMAIDSFRSLYQEKLNEKKENVKIKNMVINVNGSQGRLKDRGLNQKRIEFCKKSQDQVRLRYKYYNYNYKSANISKSSIKYRTINPESTFNTIDA